MSQVINLAQGSLGQLHIERNEKAAPVQVSAAQIKASADEQTQRCWHGVMGFIQYVIACLVCWWNCDITFYGACETGNVRLVASHMLKGNIRSDGINEGIQKAYINGNFEAILAIISKDPSILTTDYAKRLLPWTLGDGHTDFALKLIEKGADVNARLRDGKTPLLIACEKDQLDVVKALLAKKADPNTSYQPIPESQFERPLTIACERGSVEIVKELLKAEADAARSYRTFLYAGLTSAVETLLKAGCDITTLTMRGGRTALHEVCLYGKNEILQAIIPEFAYDISNPELARQLESVYGLQKNGFINAVDKKKLTALDHALAFQDPATAMAMARTLLKAGATSTHGLLTALERGLDRDIIETLVKTKQNLDALDKDGLAAIHLAAKSKDTALLGLLIDNEASIDLKTTDGKTALQIALEQKDAETAKFLIEKGASTKGLLLMAYAQGMPFELMKLMIEKKENDLDALDEKGGALIHRAVLKRDHKMIKLLAANGAKVDLQTKNYHQTPLQIALRIKDITACKLLVELGADKTALDQLDNKGYAPIHRAITAADGLDMFQFLIENSASLDTPALDGQTRPLTLAMRRKDKNLVWSLLNKGASIDIADAQGNTPIHWMVVAGDAEALKILLAIAKERDPEFLNRANKVKATALHMALQMRDTACAKVLLEAGARADLQEMEGNSALHLAALLDDNTVLLKILVRNRLPEFLNMKNSNGETALLIAAEREKIIMAAGLLKVGADRTIQNGQGRTALEIAKEKAGTFGDQTLVDLLLPPPRQVSPKSAPVSPAQQPVHKMVVRPLTPPVISKQKVQEQLQR